MHLAKIENLASLLLHNVRYPEPTTDPTHRRDPVLLDDVIVRAWSLCVDEGYFTKLKAIIMVDEPKSKSQTLKYLAVFPALTLCGLSNGLNRTDPASEDNSWMETTNWKPLDECVIFP
jgi:hypothetical protein